MKTRAKEFVDRMKRPEFAEWFRTRPETVKWLVQAYPYEKYIVKEGAPYKVSCAGTVVTLETYTESGKVGVVVRHENFLPTAIEHLREMAGKFHKNFDEIIKSDHFVHIDPKWLIPYE